jgi:cytochrome P450
MQTTNRRDITRLLRDRGQQAWVELALRYGKTFRHGNVVATCEPELVRTLLMNRVHTGVRPPTYKMLAKLPGANGILFLDGDSWLTRMRALVPVLHARNVDSYADAIHTTALAYADQWRSEGRVPDLQAAAQALGGAAVLCAGFGLDPDDDAARELAQALIDYKQFTMRSHPRFRLDEFDTGPSKLLDTPWILIGMAGMMRRTNAVHHAVRRVVARRRVRSERPDWITQLTDAGLSKRDLSLEINHLYGAFNAVDYAVAAALYELSRHHALTSTLRAEMLRAVDDHKAVTRDDLPALPFTHAFMLEVFRRYPVALAVMRRVGAALSVEGEIVRAGQQAMILLHAMHHHPDFWDDPDHFEPRRWLASKSPKVPFSYVPFLNGSRKCIGRAMAEMHFLAVIGAIVRRFDVRIFAEPVISPFLIPRFGNAVPFSLDVPAIAAA